MSFWIDGCCFLRDWSLLSCRCMRGHTDHDLTLATLVGSKPHKASLILGRHSCIMSREDRSQPTIYAVESTTTLKGKAGIEFEVARSKEALRKRLITLGIVHSTMCIRQEYLQSEERYYERLNVKSFTLLRVIVSYANPEDNPFLLQLCHEMTLPDWEQKEAVLKTFGISLGILGVIKEFAWEFPFKNI